MSIHEYGPSTINTQVETQLPENNPRTSEFGKNVLANVLPFTDYARRVITIELSDCEDELTDLGLQRTSLLAKHRDRIENIANCTGLDERDVTFTPSHEDQLAMEACNRQYDYIYTRVVELRARLRELDIIDIREEEAQDELDTSYY